MEKKTSSAIGKIIKFITTYATLILITLRACDVIDWPWYWVLSPLALNLCVVASWEFLRWLWRGIDMAESMHIEIIDNSPKVKEEFESAVLRALEECGLTAEKYAKQLCPVDTGELRNSITHLVDSGEQAAYIGSNSGHAVFVEMGTGKFYPGGRPTPWTYQDAKGNWHLTHGQRAQPYMKPAVADHVGTYKEIIEKELKG